MSRPLLGLALLLGVTVLAVWWSGATASGGVSGDAIARFAYLAILAALVGAWAVRMMPRQNMLRNAILWTLIILVLVVIYGLGGFA